MRKTPLIVGLAGRAGAGKDFVFSRLAEKFPQACRFGLADGVKLEIEQTVGKTAPGEYVPLPALWQKPYAPEIRKLLQWWGTDLRRAEDENYWVDKTMARIERYSPDTLALITDVRFVNEAEAVLGRGGIVVRIEASKAIRAERLGLTLAELEAMEHASEIEADKLPYTIKLFNSSRTGEIGGLNWLETMIRARLTPEW